MKKIGNRIVAFLTGMTMIVTLLAVAAVPVLAAAFDFTLTASAKQLKPGDEFTVTISAESFEAEEYAELYLSYPKDVVEYMGDDADSQDTSSPTVPTAGQRLIQLSSGDYTDYSATFTFKVVAETNNTAIFSFLADIDDNFYDANSLQIPVVKNTIVGISAEIGSGNIYYHTGESFNAEELTVYIVFDDGTKVALSDYDDCEIVAPDPLSPEGNVVTVTYGEYESTLELDVSDHKFVHDPGIQDGHICKESNHFGVGCGLVEEHVTGEAYEEKIPASYSEPGSIDTVVPCNVCGEASRTKNITEQSLMDQADSALESALKAAKEADAHTGEFAVDFAGVSVDAAQEACEATEKAYEAAVSEGLEDNVVEAARKKAQAAKELLEAAKERLRKAKEEAKEAADVRDEAVAMLAHLNSLVDGTRYKALSYDAYKEAYAEFNQLVLYPGATAEQFRSARTAVIRAYTSLDLKDKQSITTGTSSAKIGYATLAKGERKFKLVTCSANEGALTYSKDGGSSYASVNSGTGEITLRKGAPAGTHSVRVKITAAATDDCFAASTIVTVNVTVNKAKQSMSVKPVTKTVKATKVKRSAQKVSGAIQVKNAIGTKTYKKISGSKNLKIDAKTGKISVKKGTRRGVYKIKVKVTAAGNKNYTAAGKNVVIKVRVK